MTTRYKLPEEVGLAPLPKTDRRSRMYRIRPKQVKRYVVYPKDRPDLFQ